MRPIEEIQADVIRATDFSDSVMLLRCAAELDDIQTPLAEATANKARGRALYLRGDYPASLDHFNRSLVLFEELEDLAGSAGVTASIGSVYRIIGEYAVSLEHYHRALAQIQELGDLKGGADITSGLGHIYADIGDIPTALEHYHRALAVFEELADLHGMAQAMTNIGINLLDRSAALEYHRRALAQFEELGDRQGVANVLCNIGLVHEAIGNLPEALENYHRSLALQEALGNRRYVAHLTVSISNIHEGTGDFALALEHIYNALAIYDETGDRSGVALVTGNIGWIHYRAGNYSEALVYFQRALPLHDTLGERQRYANDLCNIVLAQLKLNEDAQAAENMELLDTIDVEPGLRIWRALCRAELQTRSGDLDGATATLQRSLEEAHEFQSISQAADVHKALRDVALKQNNLASYVLHNDEYLRIIEEINGKDTTTKLAMQEAERKMAKERNEHEKHLAILHSTLPKHIADRVARGEVVTDHHDNAAVLFLDIAGFTTISDQLSSAEVVQLLERIFSLLDSVCEKHDVVKIKTIGDSYMAVAFEAASSEERIASSEQRVANAALEMLDAISHILPDLPEGLLEDLRATLPSGIEVRIGLHSGSVTAGVLGTTRMQYDVWGDTVNVASRMESSGEAGKIHVSEAFAIALSQRLQELRLQDGVSSLFPVPCSLFPRGELEVKGKGTMQTYWLESPLA